MALIPMKAVVVWRVSDGEWTISSYTVKNRNSHLRNEILWIRGRSVKLAILNRGPVSKVEHEFHGALYTATATSDGVLLFGNVKVRL